MKKVNMRKVKANMKMMNMMMIIIMIQPILLMMICNSNQNFKICLVFKIYI